MFICTSVVKYNLNVSCSFPRQYDHISFMWSCVCDRTAHVYNDTNAVNVPLLSVKLILNLCLAYQVLALSQSPSVNTYTTTGGRTQLVYADKFVQTNTIASYFSWKYFFKSVLCKAERKIFFFITEIWKELIHLPWQFYMTLCATLGIRMRHCRCITWLCLSV